MGQEDYILVSPLFPLNLKLIVVKTVVTVIERISKWKIRNNAFY